MNNPTIDGVCQTCKGSGKEYDGAAHTCTACNGISKPAMGPCKVVAWRGVNEYGEIVTEWIDGEPTPSVDLFGRPASYDRIELAYADDLQIEVERLQRAEKNDLIAYKAAIEKQKELREEIKSLRDSEDKWYQHSVNLTVERDALQSTIARLEARVAELESGRGEPVLFVAKESIADQQCVGMHATRKANDLQCVPLFTAPPAPVAVVLPERRDGEPYWSQELDPDFEQRLEWAQDEGWNACIDASAALNGAKS